MQCFLGGSLNNFFDRLFRDIDCQRNTRAYIISIYDKYKTAQYDLSKNSITLLFAQARDQNDFLTYRTVGDWLFFTGTAFPKHLCDASADYYNSVARLSYYSCYNLIRRQWICFQELADRFVVLQEQVKYRLPYF